MFGRLAFNRLTFNRDSEIWNAKATLAGVGTVNSISSIKINLSATLAGAGTAEGRIQGDFSATLAGVGAVEGTLTKYKTLSATVAGAGTVDSEEFIINSFVVFSYSGPLEPGDILIIDTDKKTVQRNGENFLFFYSGSFFDLLPGNNIITYSDTKSSRTLTLASAYSGRYL
jgi:hypothetical protein